MNDDTGEAEGYQPMVEMSSSPRKVQQNVCSQGITLTRVNASLTNSPTKITVIPATVRNAPIRIVPAPNKGVVTPTTQISIPSSGQQRVFTIQTPNSLQSGVNPIMTAVSSTGQLLHYTTQNMVKTLPKIQVQGRQVQYLHLLNPSKSVTPVSCVTTSSSSSTQVPLSSCPTLQMVVIPPSKQDVQVKTKPVSTAKIKPVQEVVTHKEDTKPARQMSLPPEALLPRKPCNCTKSQCLKLYCECFANGEFCNMCKCVNCFNNLEHEEERQKAIKSCLDRNRDAFRPKIGKGLVGDGRRHNKGCQCKRSGCLKNYCECYEAKISCTDMCRCVGCRNSPSAFGDVKEILNEVVDVKSSQDPLPKTYRAKLEPQSQKNAHQGPVVSKRPKVFMTPAVIEATCQCMVAQAVDAKRQSSFVSSSQLQRIVMQEFGKCLVHIVESARNLNANVSNGKIDSYT